MRTSIAPLLEAGLAAAVSYWIGLHLLGHPYPFFAPIAAWFALGFTTERSLRRVFEVGVGVGIGVGLGEVIVHLIGTGPIQVASVLMLAAIVARFLDRGVLLSTQAGTQAIVIVGLPANLLKGGGLGRWTDALVGVAVALLVVALMPNDPRRRIRRYGTAAMTELAETFDAIVESLEATDADARQVGLLRGRAAQGSLESWTSATAEALDTAKLSASGRRHVPELTNAVHQAVLAERALRSIRVLARRVSYQVLNDDGHLAGLLEDSADACRLLADDITSARTPHHALAAFRQLAQRCDPGGAGEGDWQTQSLILLLRTPIVDLLEAAGASPQEARDALSPISDE